MKAQRVDMGTLRPVTRRDDGTVVCDAYLTRCGVLEYMQPDGSVRRELRPHDEVADPSSLATLEGRPVTDDHPSHMLSADDATHFARGAVAAGAKMDGEHVCSRLSAWDGNLVRKMDSGVQQLSCGYECDLDETPGVDPKYGRYDAIQRNIKYNHVAVLEHGRAGTARVRMDGAGIQIGDLVTPHGHATITPVKVSRTDMQKPSATAVVDPDDEANRSARGANDAPVKDAIDPQAQNRPMAGHAPEGEEPDEDDEGDGQDAYDASYVDGELTQAARDKIKASNFAVPDKEKLPIHDKPHVRAAMSRFGQTDFESADEKHGAFNRIVKKAKDLGVSSKGFEKTHANKLDRIDRDTTRETTMTDAEKKAAEQMKNERDAEKARADRLDGEMASLRKDLEALKGTAPRNDAAEKEFAAKVAGRVSLETKATTVLGAADRSKLSDRDIKLAVIKHVDHEDVPAEKPDPYVDAMFDGAVKRFTVGAQGQFGARAAIEQTRADAGGAIPPAGGPAPAAREDAEDVELCDEKAAKLRMKQRSNTAWQTRIDTAAYKNEEK